MDRSLEFMADNFFFIGRAFYEDEDIEQARKYLSVSFGVYRSLERLEKMNECKELLELTGLDQREIQESQNKGYDILLWALDVYNMIHKMEREEKLKKPKPTLPPLNETSDEAE